LFMPDEFNTPPVVVDQLTGTLVGRFIVGKRLGAGGMGQVYVAEDPTLKRLVAIKRAAPRSRSDPKDRKRFLKEAQRASALNHPNLGGVYDVVEHAGELWLVMEYVEGETLRHRLKRPISRDEFFVIAMQCCEGLNAAHEQAIIHGDIKPENIMITPGNRAKILDFGVARRAWTTTPDTATRSMETMTASGGTPAYMAPEVLLQKPDDGRSDIFSLGLVFYEMLGGEQPFHSDSLATTVARIVHEDPPPLKNVPAKLAAIIWRMIAKNPDQRYAQAPDVLEDLRRVQRGGSPLKASSPALVERKPRIIGAILASVAVVALLASIPQVRHRVGLLFGRMPVPSAGTAPALPQTKILAVLPFAAIPGNTKLTALGEGVVESIGGKLAKLTGDRAFEVVSPGNLLERKIASLPDAAHNFGANLGLAVSFEPQPGDLVKVAYSVQNAQSDATVGSDSVSVPMADIFSLEQKIAQGAVKYLQLQLRPEEEAALQYHGTENAAAYQYYLQAQGYLLDHTKAENLDNAMLMAREALKLDPNFGMAKAVLGQSYWFKYSDTKQQQWIGLAETNCDDAVKLGNAGADGHLCLGHIDSGTGLYPEAESEFELALALEPTNEGAALGVAHAYQSAGKVSEAEKAFQQSIQAHPNSRFSYNDFGAFYQEQNDHEKALQMYNKVTQIAPEWYVPYVNMGSIYNDMGQYEKGIEASKKSIAIRPTYAGYVNLGAAYFGLQKFDEAASASQEAAKLDPQQYVIWGNLGDALYQSGKKDQAAQPLRKAVDLAAAQLKVNPRDPNVLSDLAGYDSELGDRKNSLAYLQQALQYTHNDKDVLLEAASIYNHLGETGLAVEWLAKAVHAGYAVDKIRSMHEFDNLAGTPGYQQLMKSK
jgi:tetratricopeptide (TPR) repeat protein/predicted Ser/Thr protein kinase